MPLSFEELTAEALALSDEQKGELLDLLVESLSPDEQEEIDPAFIEELDRRMEMLRTGQAKGIPAEEVYRQQEARRKK